MELFLFLVFFFIFRLCFVRSAMLCQAIQIYYMCWFHIYCVFFVTKISIRASQSIHDRRKMQNSLTIFLSCDLLWVRLSYLKNWISIKMSINCTCIGIDGIKAIGQKFACWNAALARENLLKWNFAVILCRGIITFVMHVAFGTQPVTNAMWKSDKCETSQNILSKWTIKMPKQLTNTH